MKIFCIGKNYFEHIKELDTRAEIPAKPVIFIKPSTALVTPHTTWQFPAFTQDLQHEVELVFKVSQIGKNILQEQALQYIDAITVGLDLTARDIQSHLKTKGLPWEICKAFDGSAVVGKWQPLTHYENIQNIDFHLLKNQTKIQSGNSQDMIYSVAYCISEISTYFTLEVGDLIFTGTPPGISAIQTGDVLEAFIQNQQLLHWQVG